MAPQSSIQELRSRMAARFSAYEDEILAMINEARETVLIPFCDENDLRFVAGMGSFCFWSRRHPGDEGYSRQIDEEFEWTNEYTQRATGRLVESGDGERVYPALELLSLLYVEPDGFECSIGCLMDDYRPGGDE